MVNLEESTYLNPNQEVDMNSFKNMPVDPTVVGVLVGTDYLLNFKQMCEASVYITQNKAKLIGLNIDRNDGKDRLRPSGGSLIKMIQSISGEPDVQIIGKPSTFGFDLIR